LTRLASCIASRILLSFGKFIPPWRSPWPTNSSQIDEPPCQISQLKVISFKSYRTDRRLTHTTDRSLHTANKAVGNKRGIMTQLHTAKNYRFKHTSRVHGLWALVVSIEHPCVCLRPVWVSGVVQWKTDRRLRRLRLFVGQVMNSSILLDWLTSWRSRRESRWSRASSSSARADRGEIEFKNRKCLRLYKKWPDFN